MKSRLSFWIILCIAFVDYLGIGLVYPVFAALLFDPHYPLLPNDASTAFRGAMLGILIGLTPFVQFLSTPFLGALSDKKGRKKILAYSMALGFLGYILAIVGILFHSLWLLFLYRILIGLSEGTVAIAQAMIADISEEHNKAKRFSLFSGSLGFGFTVGPFLGGMLADPATASWCCYEVPFAAASLFCLLNLLMISLYLPSLQPKESRSFNLAESLLSIQKVFLWKKMRWLFFAVFSFSFGWSSFNEFIPLLLREHFHFSLTEVGYYYAYGGIWFALSATFLTAPFISYFSPEKIVRKALLGCAACMLLFLALSESFYIWLIIPPFMWALSITYPTTSTLASNMVSGDQQGEVLGLYQSVVASAMGLSPLLLGSAVGLFPVLTAWGGAAAMVLASFAILKVRQVPENHLA